MEILLIALKIPALIVLPVLWFLYRKGYRFWFQSGRVDGLNAAKRAVTRVMAGVR